jgi:cytochrome c peroxidase
MKRLTPAALAAACALLLQSVSAHNGDEQHLADARENFGQLPARFENPDNPITPDKVELGRMLFFEPRVSLDGTVSCARCHQPSLYGIDALPKSFGVQGRQVPRNASTVLNTAGQFVQHFGGNRKDVEEQAWRALIGKSSYGNPDLDSAMAKLKAIPGYRPLFEKAFPGQADPITPENWGKAIGAYERTLSTPAPFDRYLAGDTTALTPQQRIGLVKFMNTGCSGCHRGPLLGGTMYQKFGLTMEYWNATGSAEIDKGRFVDTKDEVDAFMFKVPMLRNIARTAPYFHDGSVATLADAVRVMALTQLGRKLSDEDVKDIEHFLESLTGEIPANYREPPVLPPGPFAAK